MHSERRSEAYDVSMYDTNSSWMQIYLNVDRRDDETGETGWYGYDYIVNYQAKNEFTTTLAKYNGEGGAYGFASVGEISYRVKDNQMMIAGPLELLGIEGYMEINVEFKIADSETVYDEMEDFYCDGDVAPLGRLNYVYQNYIPGVSQITYPEIETEPDTEAPTDAPATEAPTDAPATEAPTDAPATEAPTESDTVAEKKGCGSALMSSILLLTLVSLCGTALLKKRTDSHRS